MARRSILEIYFDVLEAIESGVDKPTLIMYGTNLSWSSLCDVFETLINSGFVREEKKKKSKRYYITEKGRNALSHHLKSMVGLIQLRASL